MAYVPIGVEIGGGEGDYGDFNNLPPPPPPVQTL